MRLNVAQKLIKSHLITGKMEPGEEIGLRIDQTPTQDATGTLVMLEFEAMGLPQVKTELSAQYVDHNLLQTDFRNADDHLFLRSACRRFGIWYSRPGNGVSHPTHQQRFGKPGKTLLGSDSHTPAAGAIGMLAIGAGGLEVALAMAGEPFYLKMPKIWGVKLTGTLPDWVSAKDVILEMLRRHGVDGGVDKIIEYYGPGLEHLSAWDRHVIANMGAELGATTTVFPSDHEVRRFLASEGRGKDWTELAADAKSGYDEYEQIDLSELEPLIAKPSSPGNARAPANQCYIGSSANPGLRDLAVPAMMVDGKQVHDRVSFDINPTSREILETLAQSGHLVKLLHAGARLHQTGCNGCIGMGQAPATGRISLRTVPRNFSGRSGTKEDSVFLCSPETAAASALTGKITDPRTLGKDCPIFQEPEHMIVNTEMLVPPAKVGARQELEKGPNIKPLPDFDRLPDGITGPVLIKTGDNVSTDEIMPAGAEVLPYRSNIPEISRFVFRQIDKNYVERALKHQSGGHFIVAGSNYGQGSSREHAALAPRYLGVRAVIAKSFARIHWQNLMNFGILPLTFKNSKDYDAVEQGDELVVRDLRTAIKNGKEVKLTNKTKDKGFVCEHQMSVRQIEMVLQGSLLTVIKGKHR
jgi:aconitate hydratase